MASLAGLATPTVEVNDRVIEIEANSLGYKDGSGDVKVRHQTAGRGAGTQVITQDAETQVGMVKFTLLTEKNNTEYLKEWLAASKPDQPGNVIRLSDVGFTRNFRGMRITSEPEVAIGAEGKIEIEFMGEVAA